MTIEIDSTFIRMFLLLCAVILLFLFFSSSTLEYKDLVITYNNTYSISSAKYLEEARKTKEQEKEEKEIKSDEIIISATPFKKIPYDLSQGGTEPWANKILNGRPGKFSSFGCGPTALAMIFKSFTGDSRTDGTYDPDKVGQVMIDNGWLVNGGTVHSGIQKCAEYFGFKTENCQNNIKKIKKHLDLGHKISVYQGSTSKYTKNNGHYVCLYDYDKVTEKAYIMDPGNAAYRPDNSYTLQELVNKCTDNQMGIYAIWK